MKNNIKKKNIPNGWREVKLSDITIKIGSGITPRGGEETYIKDGVLFIRSQNVQDGNLDLNEVAYISSKIDESMKASRVQYGDILYNITGASIGRSALYNLKETKANVNQHVCIVRLKKDNPFFINVYFISNLGKRELYSFQAGGNRQGLNYQQLGSFKLKIPEIQEQKSISAILQTWDMLIEKLEKKIKLKKKIKKGIMQQLLTGNVRLEGFQGEWKKVGAGEVFKSITVKNHPNEVLLSATQELGVIPRDKLEGRVTMPAGARNTYKLVKAGDFVISLRSFQGGLEYSKYRGIVSPAYTVLKPKVKISEDFYRFYFKSYEFIGRLNVAVIGIRDGKQISYDDFCTVKIPYVGIEEQNAIANILSNADKNIELLEEKLDLFKNQKKYLLNKLITGEIRTPEEWRR